MYTKNKEETEKHRKAKNIETAIKEEENPSAKTRKQKRNVKKE